MKGTLLNAVGKMCLLAVVTMLVASTSVMAADYPNKPIQVVVPAGAGGDTDLNSRLFSKYLEKELGESLVIVNVKGGGGMLAMKRVHDADADGYTVMFFHSQVNIPKLAGLMNYGADGFQMVGIGVIDNTTVLATHPGKPYKTLQELVDYAKENPFDVEFGIQTGGYPHLIGVAIEDVAGIELNKVDVGGNAAKTVALKGHKIDVINTQYGLTYDYFKSKDFVCLGLLSKERNPLMPEVPTAAEQGFPLVFNKYFFYAMPKGTPAEIVNKFSAAMKRVVENPEYQAEAKKLFVTPTYMGPEEAAAYANDVYDYYLKFQKLFLSGSTKK